MPAQMSLLTRSHATNRELPATPRRARPKGMHPNSLEAGEKKTMQARGRQVEALLVFALLREQSEQARRGAVTERCFYRTLFKSGETPFGSDSFGWRIEEASRAGWVRTVPGRWKVSDSRTRVSIYELTEKGRAMARSLLGALAWIGDLHR